MESLQERKAKLEKEMKEIEALEKAQSIRDQEANKNELIERLLTDLRDAPLGCALPLSSVSHVKSVFKQPACKGELCGFYDTCSQIVSLTGKASPVKRSKSSGAPKVKLAEVKMNTKREKGKITYSQEGRVPHAFVVKPNEDWKAFTDRIKEKLQEFGFILSAGQIQGIGHKGNGNKYEKIVMG